MGEKMEKKKSWIKKLVENIDKKMKAKADKSCSCCNCSEKPKKK
jgi:hypothetical protein